VVFLLDVLKAGAAVLLAKALLQPLLKSATATTVVVAAALAALAGHIGRSGWGARRKAVATGLGNACSAWCRPWVLACFGCFLATLTVAVVSLSTGAP